MCFFLCVNVVYVWALIHQSMGYCYFTSISVMGEIEHIFRGNLKRSCTERFTELYEMHLWDYIPILYTAK